MANAGGMAPLICRDGQIHKPRVEGVPLGLLEDREYDEVIFQTMPGDLIVLYSDGIEDQHSLADEHYGRGRLASLLETQSKESPRAVVDAIFLDLDKFAAGAAADDDQTLIAMRVK
jgi:sigma-B regulation protein RsbU (phosphoserine phosphatase)